MTLEESLAVARSDAQVMARCGGNYKPEAVLHLLASIERAAAPFVTWLSESDARVRSGKGVEYFRARFPAWEEAGYAELRGKVRYYRAPVVPQRARRVA